MRKLLLQNIGFGNSVLAFDLEYVLRTSKMNVIHLLFLSVC